MSGEWSLLLFRDGVAIHENGFEIMLFSPPIRPKEGAEPERVKEDPELGVTLRRATCDVWCVRPLGLDAGCRASAVEEDEEGSASPLLEDGREYGCVRVRPLFPREGEPKDDMAAVVVMVEGGGWPVVSRLSNGSRLRRKS